MVRPVPKLSKNSTNDANNNGPPESIMKNKASSRFSRYRPPSQAAVTTTEGRGMSSGGGSQRRMSNGGASQRRMSNGASVADMSVYSYGNQDDADMSVYDSYSVYGMSVVDGESVLGGDNSVMGASLNMGESVFDDASMFHDNTVAGGSVYTSNYDADTLAGTEYEEEKVAHVPAPVVPEPISIPMTIQTSDHRRSKRKSSRGHTKPKPKQQLPQNTSRSSGTRAMEQEDSNHANNANDPTMTEEQDTVGPIVTTPNANKATASRRSSPSTSTTKSCAETDDNSSYEYQYETDEHGNISRQRRVPAPTKSKRGFFQRMFSCMDLDEDAVADANYYTYRNERRQSF